MSVVNAFWQRFLETKQLSQDIRYLEAFHFEMTREGANYLLELVLSGQKRATASSLLAWGLEGTKPKIGDYSIVTDWEGNPRCVIQTVQVTELPFCEVTYDICKREGEDKCLETWQQNHRTFFTMEGKEYGYEFTEDMMVLFEDFEVVYIE